MLDLQDTHWTARGQPINSLLQTIGMKMCSNLSPICSIGPLWPSLSEGLDALAPHIELETIQNNRGLVEHNAACLLTIKVQALVQGQAKQWRRPGHQVKYAHRLKGARFCGGRRVQSQFHKAALLWFV